MRGNSIGSRIEKLRKSKGITQAALGEELGVKRETINQWESNTRDLKTKATIDLANFFHVSCDYILRGIDTEFTDVHEATGLSNNAIKKLKAHQEGAIPQLLEAILTSPRIPELAGNLSNYLTYRTELVNSTPPDFVQIENNSDHLARIKENVKENRVVLSAYAAKNYHMKRASDILNEIIEREL